MNRTGCLFATVMLAFYGFALGFTLWEAAK